MSGPYEKGYPVTLEPPHDTRGPLVPLSDAERMREALEEIADAPAPLPRLKHPFPHALQDIARAALNPEHKDAFRPVPGSVVDALNPEREK